MVRSRIESPHLTLFGLEHPALFPRLGFFPGFVPAATRAMADETPVLFFVWAKVPPISERASGIFQLTRSLLLSFAFLQDAIKLYVH